MGSILLERYEGGTPCAIASAAWIGGGTFETVTPYDEFVVFVTAENSPQPTAPSGETVLTANASS